MVFGANPTPSLWPTTEYVTAAGGASESFVAGGIIRDDLVPLVWAGAGDDGHDRFGVAQVVDLMRQAWLDEDEVAGAVLQALGQSLAELVEDPPLDDEQPDLEADMDVGGGDS